MGEIILPVGKLPADLLAAVLAAAPMDDPDLLVKPGIGFDCAVVDAGNSLLVFKSDPITFAGDALGWYLVQVNANDIATTGARPRWLLVTLLLPENRTTAALASQIMNEIYAACRAIGVNVIGGHTEITYGLARPLVVGTMVGQVTRERLVTPAGAAPGDRLLLTKGVPIEATALLARDAPERLAGVLSPDELAAAAAFLTDPGISVLPDAQVALAAGRVTAMHDPTEGGLAGALWELAEASGRQLIFDPAAVPIPELSARVCRALGLDPFATIASGALLLSAPPGDATAIQAALRTVGIICADIGEVLPGPSAVSTVVNDVRKPLPRPARDEIARFFAEI